MNSLLVTNKKLSVTFNFWKKPGKYFEMPIRELIERTDHHNKIFTDLKVRKIAPKSAAQAETKAAIAVWQKLVVINRRNMVGPLQVL